jgi:pimeloyl-ACP methyl ester carboxylesterase/uncharacterized damage-inducible protein DinB
VNFAEIPYRYPARFVVVDGLRFAYVDINPEGGAPVVFLHDIASDLDLFARAYEQLSPERRVVGIDLLGFGKSDKPRLDDAVSTLRELMPKLLTVLDVERASLVGHGYGAQLAALVAADHPERVDRLVLSAPLGARALSDEERSTALQLFGYDALIDMNGQARHAWYESMVSRWNERLDEEVRLRNELARSIQFRQWAHGVEDAAESALRHPISKALGQIEAPTLVVWGVDDPIAPFADAAAVRDGIPGARLEPIEKCGHLSALERPAAYFDSIATFLASGHGGEQTPAAASRTAYDLDPWPGLAPEVGRLARMLFEQREVCVRLTAGMPLDDVAWTPAPGANSIGALLLHMGAVPVWYLYEMFLGERVPPDLCSRYHLDLENPDAPLTAPRKSAGRLIAEIELSHARLLEWLRPRTDADLNRTFTSRDGTLTATLRWVLWHLAEDALHHRGQISYIRRLLAER